MAMIMRIPQAKIDNALSHLRKRLSQHRASKSRLQSLLGTLIHISSCVKPGRRFVARIINFIRGAHFPVTLDAEFKLDISWGLQFMQEYNGVSLIQNGPWSLPDAVISSDACPTGCGAFYQGRYFHCEFPVHIRQLNLDINTLELMSLAIALRLWGHCLSRQRQVVACDNQQAGTALNPGRSSSLRIQKLLRDIWFIEAKFDFTVRAVHIPGIDNKIADHLSRWQLANAHREQFFELT